MAEWLLVDEGGIRSEGNVVDRWEERTDKSCACSVLASERMAGSGSERRGAASKMALKSLEHE